MAGKNIAKMKTVTVYEKEDLIKLDGLLHYYLQGDSGWLLKNELPRYIFNIDTDAKMFNVSNKLFSENNDELKNLSNHVELRLKECIAKENELLESLKNTKWIIDKFIQITQLITKETDFNTALQSLLKYNP